MSTLNNLSMWLYIQYQGSIGIRQWPIDSYTSLLMIHKITPSADENKWFKRFGIKINESTNSNAKIKSPSNMNNQ